MSRPGLLQGACESSLRPAPPRGLFDAGTVGALMFGMFGTVDSVDLAGQLGG